MEAGHEAVNRGMRVSIPDIRAFAITNALMSVTNAPMSATNALMSASNAPMSPTNALMSVTNAPMSVANALMSVANALMSPANAPMSHHALHKNQNQLNNMNTSRKLTEVEVLLHFRAVLFFSPERYC